MEVTCLGLFVILCLGVHRSSSEVLLRQKRNWIIDSFTIDEGYDGEYPYALDRIVIEKDLTLFKIHGQGVDLEPRNVLTINEGTGEIIVLRPVDYEKFQLLKLIFQAIDKEKNIVDTQLGVDIKIIDSNDNPPRFDHATYEVNIKESTLQGTKVITLRATDSDLSEKYKQFDYRIASVTPQPQGLEFYLTQASVTQTADISFKGCLDHEKAEKYVIIVEAKDRGEPKQLSSSCKVTVNIDDRNNHLPVIISQTGAGRVKEGDENVLVLRLQATDEDAKGTAAWRAKYEIQGDTNKNFRITTDPETNDGLLYVQKPLDYEATQTKSINISVQNEIPFYSCQVKERSTTGLWKVIIIDAASGAGTVTGTNKAASLSSCQVTVIVEDINDPPVFNIPVKTIKLLENVEVGRYLEMFSATDHDIASGNIIVYKKGEDVADWVTVDATTGKVTTSQIIDRESHFVNNSIYVVTIYAVDNGEPPATGTGTLTIHIIDENDNAPSLVETSIDVCQSAGPSMARIAAEDLDNDPYGGPFNFKLRGDVKGKWKVDPVYGFSVNLVKESIVHGGHYELWLEVSDLQGMMAVHNLSVTVCNCTDITRPNCHSRSPTSTAGGGALGIIFLSMLLLAGLLLVGFLMSCKDEKIPIPDDMSGQHLMISNTEKPGTDCKVAFETLSRSENAGQIQTTSEVRTQAMKPVFINGVQSSTATMSHSYLREYVTSQTEILQQQQQQQQLQQQQQQRQQQQQQQMKHLHWSMGASSAMGMRHQQRNYMHWGWMAHGHHSHEIQLNKLMHTLQAPGRELVDYEPHVYAEEGDTEHNFELDDISIDEIPFDPNMELDFTFSTLASICMPSDSTATVQKETATLIEVESHKRDFYFDKVTRPSW